MPGGGGVEVIEQVAKQRPQQRFLALSVSDDPQDVIAIVRAGARGYVTKSITGDELADAVARVRDGDAVFSPRLAGFVLDAFAGDLPAEEVDPELDQLTAREREVLRYIARGYLYKEIALRLHISVKTVEAHVSSVLRKLQLSNRHELSRWAVSRAGRLPGRPRPRSWHQPLRQHRSGRETDAIRRTAGGRARPARAGLGEISRGSGLPAPLGTGTRQLKSRSANRPQQRTDQSP